VRPLGRWRQARSSRAGPIALASFSRSQGTRLRSSPSSTSYASTASSKARISRLSQEVSRPATSRSTTWCRRLSKAAPDATIAGGDVIPRAFQNATRTIPIVVITEDMVAAGFAASLARPGGNITGISLMSPDLDGKRQDILIEAVPSAPRIAALADSNVATLRHLQALEEAARAHRKELLVVRAAKAEELVPAMNDASTHGAGALNVLASPMLFLNRRVIIQRAAELRLPTVYQWPETAEEGGLLGYGPRFVDVFRQRARMVAKIAARNGQFAGRAAHHVRACD
jgi:ABC-type uncharacterized transport system substrate-binding protein